MADFDYDPVLMNTSQTMAINVLPLGDLPYFAEDYSLEDYAVNNTNEEEDFSMLISLTQSQELTPSFELKGGGFTILDAKSPTLEVDLKVYGD